MYLDIKGFLNVCWSKSKVFKHKFETVLFCTHKNDRFSKVLVANETISKDRQILRQHDNRDGQLESSKK